MKRLALLTAVLLAVPATAQDWTTIDLGVTGDIHEFNYGGFSDKWLSGDGGLIAESIDLQNWTIATSGTGGNLTSMVRWNSQAFLAGGGAGVVRKSTDGGTVWTGANIPDASQTYSLYSRSSGWANAVGDGGTIYQTRTAGDTWFVVYSGSTPLHDGSGFIGSISRAVGDDGLVLKTTDGGTSWGVQPTGTTDNLYCFLEGGGGYLFAAGENGTILRSGDGGDTWNRQVTGTSESIRDIRSSAVSGTVMVAVGDNGTVLRTTNYGDDWCVIDPQTTADLLCVFVQNASTFVIGGEGGLLIYTETGGGECSDILPVQPDVVSGVPIPPAVTLSAPSPNPFGTSTSFAFALPWAADGADVRVTILDVTGRLVRRLVDRAIPAGGYRVVWDGLDDAGVSAANGVYVVRLTAGAEVDHQRVTVLR